MHHDLSVAAIGHVVSETLKPYLIVAREQPEKLHDAARQVLIQIMIFAKVLPRFFRTLSDFELDSVCSLDWPK